MPDDLRMDFRKSAYADKEKVQLSKDYNVICMIGCTGHGKSATANSICGAEFFGVSASTGSETDFFEAVLTRWRNKPEEDRIIVIDTPGIGDSRNRDTKHIA